LTTELERTGRRAAYGPADFDRFDRELGFCFTTALQRSEHHRARGELDLALDAVDNVLMLDEHVGALALAAEIHTSREEWEEAVRALGTLAGAEGVPKAQRRLARLGAADFLLHRLGRAGDALAMLEQVVADGHQDVELMQRVAEVAQRADKPQRASEAILICAEHVKGEDKARLLKQAALLQRDRLHRDAEAAALFRRALEASPRDREAMRALWSLSHDQAALARFEREVRAALQREPASAEPLRDLLLWSELASDPDSTFVALATLIALEQARDDERRQGDAALKASLVRRPQPSARLAPSDLGALLAPAPDARYAAVLQCVLSAASEIDHLEPGKFGVGRGQRVNPRDKSPLRDEVQTLCSVLGLTLNELYVGGNELLRVAAIPQEGAVSLVLGMGVNAPLSATRRSQLSLQLAACTLHT
ncbi:MAG TPA: hypothetical protein VFZ61_05305, partial [Polyangiales bacterium]